MTGSFYGDFQRPEAFGSSGGGGSGDTIAYGGGVLRITTTRMIHDGSISVNGEAALESSDNGGGSGGSVFIVASNFDGSGIIQANGGAGGGNAGGGGSGGRIAVYYNLTFFSGTITAYGGDSSVEAGAAGTIFKRDVYKGHSVIEIFNRGRKPLKGEISDYSDLARDSARTWLSNKYIVGSLQPALLEDLDIGVTIYTGLTIDEVRLGGSAHFAIEPENTTILLHTFHKFYGTYEENSYGFLHVGPRQLLNVPNTDYYIPVNLKIYAEGYVKLPSKIMLHKNSLSLNGGYIIGVQDLTISECRVSFGPRSGALSDGSLFPTRFQFHTVRLMSNGLLEMVARNANYSLDTESLVINSGGVLVGRNVTITAKMATIDESGKISLDAQGENCPGTDVYYAGSGGSHAGYGGLGGGSKRYEPFGLVFSPRAFGRAGFAGRSSARCNSGHGGGTLNMTVSDTLRNDGEISSR